MSRLKWIALSYLVKEYVIRKNLQIIVCSHSPEILAGAFDNDECGLYHLVSENNLSKVRQQDHLPLADALQKLGASESDDLLYRGIIFVEGIDDKTLLEAGFSSLLKRFKITESKGRTQVEKIIESIQKNEKEGIEFQVKYFIFDKDDVPTNLNNSKFVKILQWDRRCLENYLIDLDSISNLLMNPEITNTPFSNYGEVSQLIRRLAFEQLDEVATRRVYQRYAFESTGIKKDEIKLKKINEITEIFFQRLKNIQQQVSEVDESWKSKFQLDAEAEKRQLEAIWETNWQNDCDGKKLLNELHKSTSPRMNIRSFKTRIIKEMALNQSDLWKTVKANIEELISP